MEGHLQSTADGSAGPLRRWYALAHSARCGRCNRFLHSLEALLAGLRQGKQEAPPEDAMERLRDGAWREEVKR
jgi:hypothetical protein